MTIPDTSAFRTKKPGLPRTKAERSGSGGGGGGGSAKPPESPPKTSEGKSSATERAVKSGYEAVKENIVQARMAAERFRQGRYNINEVPGDLTKMSGRLSGLAGDFSAAGIEILQYLIKAAGPAGDAAIGGYLNLKVSFRGETYKGAKALTDMLARPTTESALPKDIKCAGLKPGPVGSGEIGPVEFTYDLTAGALVATVILPRNLQPGVYSGLVYVEKQGSPLGVLSVEIPSPNP